AVAAPGPTGAVGAVGAAGQVGEVGAGKQAAAGRPGTPLAATTLDGMQAFSLPTTAADVVVYRLPDRRADWLLFELAVLVIALLGAIPAGGRAGAQRRPGRSARSDVADSVAPSAAEVARA
ncbi:MAG TPA: hypothetical protein VII33_05555, partial [Nakamurella sp.]